MKTISVNYNIDWILKDNEHYQFTKDGKCFNAKRGKQLKRSVIGYTTGYYINGKFKSLKQLSKLLIKYEGVHCPF